VTLFDGMARSVALSGVRGERIRRMTIDTPVY
jgi:hypothetical protein